MEYRVLGKTGIKVSKMGFGVAKLPVDERGDANADEIIKMVDYAVKNGINYFDLGDIYVNEQCFSVMKVALQPYKNLVHMGYKLRPSKIKKKSDLRKIIISDLEKLDLEHFEFFLFWGINLRELEDIIFKFDLLDEIDKMKKEGILKHIGFSFHDAAENLKKILDASDIWEFIMCQYNLFNQIYIEGMRYAFDKNIGIIIMGSLAGGSIISSNNKIDVPTAFKFVMDNPIVSCALSGTNNLEMLKENIRIANIEEKLSEKNIQNALKEVEKISKLSELYCTGCKYCYVCPQGIDIPYIFKVYNMSNVYNLHAEAIYEYKKFLAQAVLPEQCVGCKICMKNCPQNIEIPYELKKIRRYFYMLEKSFVYKNGNN